MKYFREVLLVLGILAGESWELKYINHGVAKVEKHWYTVDKTVAYNMALSKAHCASKANKWGNGLSKPYYGGGPIIRHGYSK